MNTTQVLLEKIAALRQRLVEGEHQTATQSVPASRPTDPLLQLDRRVTAGNFPTTLIEGSTRELFQSSSTPREAAVRLSARGLRLLQRGRELLQELRGLADEPVLLDPRTDALAALYQRTAAMLDLALRAAQTVPQAAGAQARWCDGLEATLNVVGDRLATLLAGLESRRRSHDLVESLADLLDGLARGSELRVQAFAPLVEKVLEDVRQDRPLRFHQRDAKQPAQFLAAHGLVTAQVLARLTRHDPEWQQRADEPVLAGLLHDVGMLRVPADILAQRGPLNDEQRRHVEYHPIVGAEILSRLAPGKGWLMEAAVGHHERIDGTGYPSGLREPQIPTLTRLVTVADIYAALCCPRPYRAAFDTRTAMTDTLLLADQGALDRFAAEKLLDLSFFPVGSVVELADGAAGIVIGVHSARKDLRLTSKPMVALLTDARGEPLPFPVHLDLGQVDGRSIVRALPVAEQRELLGTRYPELVAVEA
ncbi:MAG: HD domain-containing protein [Planctomycetes bacterium]|nr:HD domain-containing protein [Planctomycetota bacterium]